MAMSAVVKLAVIGENYRQLLRAVETGKAPMPDTKRYIELLRYGRPEFKPWIARLTDGRKMESVRDYSAANGMGSRGIYECYALEPGIYEVNACVKLGKMHRYCLRVNADTTYEELPCPSAI